MKPVEFWKRVEKTESCWLWKGSSRSTGYGLVGYQGKTKSAHVYSLMLAGRETPPGLEVDHMCRVRNCVNPDHLRFVTHRTNMLENCDSVITRNFNKTHCLRGHPLSGDNLRECYVKRGHRACKACFKIYIARRDEKRRSARLGAV